MATVVALQKTLSDTQTTKQKRTNGSLRTPRNTQLGGLKAGSLYFNFPMFL